MAGANDMNHMYNVVLVRPGEFMVRWGSPVRRMMIRRLVESMERKLGSLGLEYDDIELLDESRILVINPEKPLETARRVSMIFGVSSTSPGILLEEPGIEEIYSSIKELIIRDKPRTIALRVRGGLNGLDREDIIHVLASLIQNRLNIFINLRRPDREITIENRGGRTIIMDRVFNGVGGLPYGVEGCMVVLVSGGVDSALSAWFTMKRGVRIIPLYIDYGSYWGVKAHSRIDRMLKLIKEWVPWDQLKIYRVRGMEKLVLEADIPSRLRCLFCKANMYRVAGYVMEREKCKGVVTGESIGQVASQTLNNLYVITRLSRTPIYRPVAFMDKLEIVEMSNRLGFGELNIRVEPCRLKPDKPETSATERDYRILERALKDTEEEAYRIFMENTIVEILK